MAMAAIPAAIEAAGTAAQVIGGAKSAYDIGKKYKKQGKAVAKAVGTAKGRANLKAQAVAFKKKKGTTKLRIAKKAVKKAYKKTGEILSDTDKLGDVAGAVGKVTGSESLQGASQALKGAAAAGREHRANLKGAAKQVKATWHESINSHNPPGAGSD